MCCPSQYRVHNALPSRIFGTFSKKVQRDKYFCPRFLKTWGREDTRRTAKKKQINGYFENPRGRPQVEYSFETLRKYSASNN